MAVVRSRAGWSGIIALSDATARTGLVNVFTLGPSPLMKLNGNTTGGVTYLAANIVPAERAGYTVTPPATSTRASPRMASRVSPLTRAEPAAALRRAPEP
jgi:hypothetical protein